MRLFVGFVILLPASPLLAQGVTRLDFTEPQIVLTPGGRTGACDELRFTKDGSQLLAVGDDKVVHTWDVTAAALEYRPPLRWNVFRERRGAAYAVALSPDETRVAIGGFGRLDADVVVLDRASGKIVAALSSASHPSYRVAGTVWSLAFHEDGRRIAVGLEDGTAWLWDSAEQAPAGVKLLANYAEGKPEETREAVRGRLAKIVWVGFHGDAVRMARGDGRVFESLADGKRPTELFRFDQPIAQAVAPADARWLACRPLRQTEAGSRIEVRSFPDGELVREVKFEKNAKNEHRLFPVSLATDSEGKRLAVGSTRPAPEVRFFTNPPGEVAVYDLAPETPKLAAIEVLPTPPDTIAFHPDGRRLAMAGGHDHETALWEIAGTRLKRVGEPSLSAGRGVWQVGTANDGNTLCFRHAAEPVPKSPNDRGRGDWRRFDLKRLGWEAGTDGPAEPPVTTLNGWSIEFGKNEFDWTAMHEDGFRYPLTFEKGIDDRPTCYTFLPAPNPRRVRLAVGAYWGFVVYEIGKGVKQRRVMKGIGHHGYVTSIAPARGGRMLVTGSNDQTICLWAVREWDHHPALGAKFEWQFDPTTQRRVFVATAVAEGSPAWEAGLLQGDRVAKLGYDVAWVEKEAAWQAALDDAEPDRELAFLIDRPVGDKVVRTAGKTRLLTRPQARFFPTAGSEWVLYKYLDFYYASSTNGESLLAWQLSGKTAADSPELHPAVRFRDLFHKPEDVRTSLARLIREPNRPLTREYLPPTVSVKTDAGKVTDRPLSLTIAVTPRADVRGQTVPLEKVELWLDDEVLLRSWAGGEGEFKTTVAVKPHELRVGRNRLSVVGYAKTRGEAAVVVENAPAEARLPSVRGVAVAVDSYPYLSAAEQLTASVNDAKLIRDTFDGLARDKAVKGAKIDLLLNEQVTPEAVFARIEEAGKTLGPDDWFVLFFAGHGFADLEQTADGILRVKPGSWFFCGHGPKPAADWLADPKDQPGSPVVRRTRALIAGLRKLKVAIDGTALLDKLAKLNCRKLILLDSCHSGAVAVDPGRDLRPGGRGAAIITASAPDEAASEFDIDVARGGKVVTERHGFFSVAVYDVLTHRRGRADRNADGVLTLEELHAAVADAVKAGRKRAGIDKPGGRSQTVLACPPDLRNVVLIGTK